jgi:beta-phosphoglucomutase
MAVTDSALAALRSSIRGVIFDMDGVLVQSSPAHACAFRSVLAQYGIDFQYEEVAGMRTRDALQLILSSHNVSISDSELTRLATEKSAAALASLLSNNPIAPGALDILAHLGRRFPLGLATSASEASLCAFLDQNQLRQTFTCVVGGHEVARAKPSPDIYVSVIRQFGIPAKHCLVVEDAISGVAAAKAAGAMVCGLVGTTTKERLLDAGADAVIRNLQELEAI